ncbi:MAG: Ig-like domain-containing protein [Capsulimonas sp.]|uniref:Ig-like domain-containing protein n=1 Tax=Capsulimonas sp. TaxID=2494211 RepID=UPI0032670AB5
MRNQNTSAQTHSAFSARRLAPKAAALCFAITCGAATSVHAQPNVGGALYAYNTPTEGERPCDLASPQPEQKFTAPAAITITATQKKSSTLKIGKVEFYSGDHLVGSAAAAPYTFVLNNVPAGSYKLKALVYNDAGKPVSLLTVNAVVKAAVGVGHISAGVPALTLSSTGTLQVVLPLTNDGSTQVRALAVTSITAYDDPSGRKTTLVTPKLPSYSEKLDAGAVVPFTFTLNNVLPTSGNIFLIVNGVYTNGDKKIPFEFAGGLAVPAAK